MNLMTRTYNYISRRVKKNIFFIKIRNEFMWYSDKSARKFRKKYFLNNDLKSRIVLQQLVDPLSIPILIINFNQLRFLKVQVDFFLKRGFKNIIILDNNSNYPPLLEYYNRIKDIVRLEMLDKNFGHMVFFENKELYDKYSKGFFVLTDSDVIPNDRLPENFMTQMVEVLIDNYDSFTKVGWALDIESIPETYLNKQRVINWEKQFWKEKIDVSIFQPAYVSEIDTTFALYKPNYDLKDYSPWDFFKALRIAGDFTAKHGGWYINSNDLTDEQQYYFKYANSSSSWRIDSNGELNNEFFKKFY